MAPIAFAAPSFFSYKTLTSSSSSFLSPSPKQYARKPFPQNALPVVKTNSARKPLATRFRASAGSLSGKRILVIGGTRFSGIYLVYELAKRGAAVVILNRGSKQIGDPSLRVPGESADSFAERNSRTTSLIADRSDPEALKTALKGQEFDVIFDNNGRKLADSASLIDTASQMGAHFVYMSSAGVYLKSDMMPHIEADATDPNSRHRGKLDTEEYLRSSTVKYTAIRPTYIYGALNYNPLDQWFFERLDKGMPIYIPGHGAHLTGLGHVRDLASAMAACALNPSAYSQVYNIQDRTAVTFDGVARLCAKAMGKSDPEIVHYNPKEYDFGKKKAFPFRPQHFFCSPNKALRELDWRIEYDYSAGLQDAYENDFLLKKEIGGLKNDFETDEVILNAMKGTSVV